VVIVLSYVKTKVNELVIDQNEIGCDT
jgi:hypothetical protein